MLALELATFGVAGWVISQFAYQYGLPAVFFAGVLAFLVGLLFLLSEGDPKPLSAFGTFVLGLLAAARGWSIFYIFGGG